MRIDDNTDEEYLFCPPPEGHKPDGRFNTKTPDGLIWLGGQLINTEPHGVVLEIIEAIASRAKELADDYHDGTGGTDAVRELCDIFDEATKSAGLREKLRRIDNVLRKKVENVIPGWSSPSGEGPSTEPV